MLGKHAKLILDLVMPKFTVQFALLQDLIKNEQDRFLEWEKDVSHLDLSHCNRLTVCYVIDKYHVTWSFQELQSEHILKSWMNSSPKIVFLHHISASTWCACRMWENVAGERSHFLWTPQPLRPKVLPAEQELIEQKFRARRAVGWKGGGSNRKTWISSIVIQQIHGSNIWNTLKQGKKGRFFAEKKDTGRDFCEFLSHARLLDVKQITKRAFCWLRRRSQTFFPGFKWWGHPRCSISVTWWLKGWRYHVIGHDGKKTRVVDLDKGL